MGRHGYTEVCNDVEKDIVKGNKGNITERKRRHDHAAQDSDQSDDSVVERRRNSTGHSGRHREKHKNIEDVDSLSSGSVLENLARSRKGKNKVCEYENSDSEEPLPVKHRNKKSKRGKHAISETSSSDESSSSDDLLKLRRCNTSEDIISYGNKSSCYYRSNLKTAVKELGSISFRECHIAAIKKTPFWFLFNALLALYNQKSASMCKKYEKDIRSIMKTFDKRRMGFLVGGELMKLHKQDVQLIFGVCDGHLPIEEIADCESPPWLKRHFAEELEKRGKKVFTMGKAAILQKLKRAVANEDETSVKDVARLTHCYLLAGVLATNQNSAMRWDLSRYLENLDDVCLYDWSTMIIDMLLKRIMKSTNMKAGGCAMLLPYWLCERSGILEPVKQNAFPRFMKWDLTKLHPIMIRVRLAKSNGKYEYKLKLKPTAYEKRKFRELIEWQDKEGPKKITNEDDKENRGKSLSQENSIPLAEPNQPPSQHVDGVASKDLFTHAEDLIGTINLLLAIGRENVDIPSTSRVIGIAPDEKLVSETPAEQQSNDATMANRWDVTPTKTEKSSWVKPCKNADRTGVPSDASAVKGNLDDVLKVVNEENANLKKELALCKTLVAKKEAEISELSSEISEIVKQKTTEKGNHDDLELKFKHLESEYKKLILRLSEFAKLEEAKLSCIAELPNSKEKAVEPPKSTLTSSFIQAHITGQIIV